MKKTITVRLSKELAEWLADKAARTSLSQGKLVRDQLERARQDDRPGFMRLAGCIRGGPSDVSTRKGFSTK
jgi:hypothetical protein